MKQIITLMILCLGAGMMFAQAPALKVASDSNVGIGVAAPLMKLHVVQDDPGTNVVSRFEGAACASQLSFLATATGGKEWKFMSTADCASLGGGKFTIFEQGVAHQLVIAPGGAVGIGTTSPSAGMKLDVNGVIKHGGLSGPSDRRLKKNINTLDYGLEEVLKLQTVTYEWNGKAGLTSQKPVIGVVAQDLQKVMPEMVGTWTYTDAKDDKSINKDNGKEFLSIQTDAIQYVLVNAIQEQQVIIDTQEERIAKLESLVANLVDNQVENQNIDLNAKSNTLGLASPNPFQGETVIEYNILDGSQNAVLNIHNNQGQLLKTINIANTGIGSITLNASDLPSGTYSYNLVVDGVTIGTKQMILNR